MIIDWYDLVETYLDSLIPEKPPSRNILMRIADKLQAFLEKIRSKI